MNDKRNLNMIISKNGAGSKSCKMSIPTPWSDELGISEDDRSVIALLKNDKIIIKKETAMKKYLVIEQFGNDEEARVFDTKEEANEEAKSSFECMDPYDKKRCRNYVIDVTEKDLAEYAFDDEGNVEDWTAYEQGGYEDGLYDSSEQDV